MDRDNRWDRVKKAYETINNANNKQTISINKYIDNSYNKGIYDEFIIPACFGEYQGIKQNDNLIFCNFRSDRMKEFVKIYSDNFDSFKREKLSVNVLTMTSYGDELDCDIWIKKDNIKNTLSQVVSDNGLRQFHISETEKYAHVTFFLNGGLDTPFKGEDRKLIPSMDVRTYDEAPEMRAKEIADGIIGAMEDKYDYIVANFANGDMVGHTGNFEAGIKAVEVVDESLGRILDANLDYHIIITSDHGNCEKMKDDNGEILTNHTITDVFCFCISKEVNKINNGALSNIAPSVLKLMKITAPNEMDNALF
jgi:2,3-bisphosphoglycerate-independent phosphoglycerate mutase